MVERKNLIRWYWIVIFLITGCTTTEPVVNTPEPQKLDNLNVSLLYPIESSEVVMGQTIKTIVQVTDEGGNPVPDASVEVTFIDPSGKAVGNTSATFGDGDVYRSDAWTVPHRTEEGSWNIQVEANTAKGHGVGTGPLTVDFSNSEILYHKYGFWLDAPTLKGIQPTIAAERGDAENGLIRWGGVILAQHVLPENWVEVHWRKGDFNLDSPEEVRAFILDEIGDLGFTPVRAIDLFKPTTFKQWDAWQAPARGQYYYQEMAWTVFYAPEVDKTYALSTTVIYPPTNIDPHEALLSSFDVNTDEDVNGMAPEPLLSLLPQPKLISPELGTIYTGLEQPIVLQWEPLKELAEDEYYQVTVDYNYKETNSLVRYATRETQFTLPEELYRLPNCSVFSWRVNLMRQTGEDKDGNPTGEVLSYNSLYRYVRWFYPLDDKAPFDPLCQNAQY